MSCPGIWCARAGQEAPPNAVCAYVGRLELILDEAIAGYALLLADVALDAQVDGEGQVI